MTPCYLVQVSPGVSQEGDGVSRPDADSHGGETSRRAVQDGLNLNSHPAGHGTRGVVGAAGIGIQSVLMERMFERVQCKVIPACLVQKIRHKNMYKYIKSLLYEL